jgi:hypothetical protein
VILVLLTYFVVNFPGIKINKSIADIISIILKFLFKKYLIHRIYIY